MHSHDPDLLFLFGVSPLSAFIIPRIAWHVKCFFQKF
nr:MAG TPA: hypothetical protein [Caudoviricetes sp.]